MKTLKRENRKLRKANEILRLASAFSAQAELDRCIKQFRHVNGVDPSCRVVQVAPLVTGVMQRSSVTRHCDVPRFSAMMC